MQYDKIGNHLRLSQYGISIEMNTEGIGYPIYRMNEMHNMLCDIDVDKYADIPKDDYVHFALRQGDVLFNRTNSFEWVGRTGVYYPTSNNEERTFASYLVRFNPTQDTILPEYLCAFLNSRYGVWDIKRRARQSINQTNVNPEEVKEIDIPLLRMDIQLKIQEYFKSANVLRLQSRLAYDEANQHLNQLLGIDNLVLTDDTITEKKYTDFISSTRLDAEYYQPKYDELINLVKSHQSGYGRLETLFLIKDRNYIPENDCLYKYIELSNIGSDGSITGHTEALGEDLPSRARRIVRSGDLIVSSLEGSLNSCAIIPEKYDGAICSTGFYVLTPKDINVETALVLFKSQLMQALMTRVCSGSIMAGMNTDEFANLIVPKIDLHTQHVIAEIIQDCAQKRDESIRLLELAKTAVEIAIEQGEDKAMELLCSN